MQGGREAKNTEQIIDAALKAFGLISAINISISTSRFKTVERGTTAFFRKYCRLRSSCKNSFRREKKKKKGFS